jgi:hypothetical protein
MVNKNLKRPVGPAVRRLAPDLPAATLAARGLRASALLTNAMESRSILRQ